MDSYALLKPRTTFLDFKLPAPLSRDSGLKISDRQELNKPFGTGPPPVTVAFTGYKLALFTTVST